MTHEEAHKILNRIRDGVAYPQAVTCKALYLTGDLDLHEAMRGSGMDPSVFQKNPRDWKAGGGELVGQNQVRHSQAQRRESHA